MSKSSHFNLSIKIGMARAITLSVVFCLSISILDAQTFTILHTFQGVDGAEPGAGLTMDNAGNFYGTTIEGGAYGFGNAFKMTHRGTGWVLTNLYSFTGGSDGSGPFTRAVFGPDGSLYGGTSLGGVPGGCLGYGCGTIYKLQPSPTSCHATSCPWNKTTLYAFTGTGGDGAYPMEMSPVFDQQGNVYGTTANGGSYTGRCSLEGCGTVFELSHAGSGWTENVLWEFMFQNDGAGPQGVIFDQFGVLYGTASAGGYYNAGAVYTLTPSSSGWIQNTIYAFHNMDDGDIPAGLIFDRLGNTLYGGTSCGGINGGGTIYDLVPGSGNWTFNTLYSLTGGCSQSSGVSGPLTMDAAGNLYGTTYTEGAYGHGSVFKLTFSNGGWLYTDLYDFTGGADGWQPNSDLVVDASGNIYGTVLFSRPGEGIVFEITPH
jgi:uncharacterized repeat protein (TIGR03803 family)